jgi:hypothetical protein
VNSSALELCLRRFGADGVSGVESLSANSSSDIAIRSSDTTDRLRNEDRSVLTGAVRLVVSSMLRAFAIMRAIDWRINTIDQQATITTEPPTEPTILPQTVQPDRQVIMAA